MRELRHGSRPYTEGKNREAFREEHPELYAKITLGNK